MNNKDKKTPYVITEWQWLELQLKLHALQYSAKAFATWFDFPTEDFPRAGKIVCVIFATQTQDMVRDKTSKKEQLEYYRSWADMARQVVSVQVDRLPVLSKTFDVRNDMIISIRQNYGMGSSAVCEIHGDKVLWPMEMHKKKSGVTAKRRK